MTAERWQQIARIYDAAADLADDERARYLAEACGGDAGLRVEVESLLADSHARLLIDTPVWESAAGLLEPATGLSPGTMLGPYRIEALLGSGGMGQVYRAYDTRLDRTVAVKVIADDLDADTAFRERFEREARVLAALRHPHICTLYDVGRDEGTEFLVMEYVEGETLATVLAWSAVCRRRGSIRGRDRRSPRCRASPRRDPSRPQARQRDDHAHRHFTARSASRDAAGLWRSEVGGCCRCAACERR